MSSSEDLANNGGAHKRKSLESVSLTSPKSPRRRLTAQREDDLKEGVWPPHAAKNRFIHSGYSEHEDWKHALSEVHQCDNESLNVLSAMLGLLPIAILAFNVRSLLANDLVQFDPFGLYTSMSLFAFSALFCIAYHTFCSIPHHYSVWSAMDFVGINVALVSLSLGMSYYEFQLFPSLHWYEEFVLVSVVVATIAAFTAIYRIVDGRDGLIWLQGTNVAGAVILVLPTHAVSMLETARGITFVALLVFGVIVHVLKVPERFFPGRLDYVGNSHAIWHISYSLAFYFFFSDLFMLNTGRADLLWDHAFFEALKQNFFTSTPASEFTASILT